jgi:LysM repeat protein
MTAKRTFQMILVAAMLSALFLSTGRAQAGSGNCPQYVTVQWGDTLSGLAAYCGVSMDAIRAANPGLGWWLYAGSVLNIPSGYSAPASASGYSQPVIVASLPTIPPTPVPTPPLGGLYTVKPADTVASIASANGISINSLLAVNSQIWDMPNVIPGQIINLPLVGNSTSAPAITPASSYSVIRVTADRGLIIREGPNRFYNAIDSEVVNALFGSRWWYRKDSVTADVTGFLWVEILFNAQVNGRSTGWILVKDTLENYFTSPAIDMR